MRVVDLASETDFDGWRAGARTLWRDGVTPGEAVFRVGGGGAQGGLFDDLTSAHPGESRDPVSASEDCLGSMLPDGNSGVPTQRLGPGFRRDERVLKVPRAFVELARGVILHRSADRFDLMYRLLWRVADEPDLIKVVSDADVADAMERAKNVSRASHKMKAFVRFRRVEDASGEAWVAWFEPAHRVVEKTAPFFQRRFAAMRWSILTPDCSAFWDGQALTVGPPATRDMAPDEDEIEEFWKTYYASTFNPARLKTKTMQGEMPKRYWKNLPEASLIPELVAASSVRTDVMVDSPATAANARTSRATAPRVAEGGRLDDVIAGDLTELKAAVQQCRRCPLWRDATQGVCGEGPAKAAALMIVGEQPGDQEDLAGRPFVGPAGQVFDEALAEAGLDRSDLYVTNAVKHFKHEPRGKRRLHKTPNAGEVQACRWWLDQERALVKPRLIVTLGATAALGVTGRKIAVTRERGVAMDAGGGQTMLATVHPSYLLRLPDAESRARERALFVRDLQQAGRLLAQASARN